MLNRRQILEAGAGLALLAHLPGARAQAPNLIIRGGRVIDPSVGLDAVRDITISAGRIAEIAPRISSSAAETLDASGRIVAPGLIDIHTHAGRDAEGPALALRDGVTGLVDAGSAGADRIDEVVNILRAAPQTSVALVNLARVGITAEGELNNLEHANVALAQEAIARNRGIVVGVKLRVSANVVGRNDLEALRRAQEIVAPFGLPIMVHVGQNYSPMRAILPLLKRGDIVTHLYAPAPNSILDEDGVILPEVTAARRRGVIFDFGHGRNNHFDWDMVERCMQQGFWPDTISTDWNIASSTTAVRDFPNVMSKLLMFGMPLIDVIACSTRNAARCFPAFEDRGTLNVGAPADIAIMELREGSFDFVDNYDGVREGNARLFPTTTVLAGQIISRTG
jgi:dihydroorotase